MYWESALSLSAEVGIGIAGFASIFAALSRRNPEVWGATERLSFSVLLAASGSAVFAGILPLILLTMGLSETSCWTIASVLLGSWLVTVATVRFRQASRTGADLPLAAPIMTICFGAMLFANAAAVHRPGLYVLAVGFQLLFGFLAFVSLLRTTTSAATRSDGPGDD